MSIKFLIEKPITTKFSLDFEIITVYRNGEPLYLFNLECIPFEISDQREHLQLLLPNGDQHPVFSAWKTHFLLDPTSSFVKSLRYFLWLSLWLLIFSPISMLLSFSSSLLRLTSTFISTTLAKVLLPFFFGIVFSSLMLYCFLQ